MSRFPTPTRRLLTAALLIALTTPAWAQSHAHGTPAAPAATKEMPVDPPVDHGSMDHSQMDHSKMDHGSMDHSQMDHSKMDHGSMDHAAHKTTAPSEPREPIPAVTAADRLAAFPPIEHGAMEHPPTIHSMLLVNRLEQWDGQHGNGQAWEASGWIGGNIHRVWVRSEGERSGGRTEAADVEVLYGRSVSPWGMCWWASSRTSAPAIRARGRRWASRAWHRTSSRPRPPPMWAKGVR